jgi:hypothetical protein
MRKGLVATVVPGMLALFSLAGLSGCTRSLCPEIEPTHGEACPADGLACSYGAVESTCEGGLWRSSSVCTECGSYVDRIGETNLDLLFMIDNSNSTDGATMLLTQQFPKLVEGLRSSRLGPAGCTSKTCRLPNLHIGIITSDLGAGSYSLPSCETAGGDGGKLVHEPRIQTGCAVPKDKWISYVEGTSNVIDASTTDELKKVENAFSCIGRVGTAGCGFEQPLESIMKALDPNINQGFLRNDPKNLRDALLAIVLLTDEDDCSAQNTKLYDPSQTGLKDPLGPLTSFRCFEFGITCDVNSRTTYGPRKDCVPTTGSEAYLYDPKRYIDFLKGVKKRGDGTPAPDRLLLFAIAGATKPVAVGSDGSYPTLRASCSSSLGEANPGIRIKAVTDGLGDQGFFESICAGDFSAYLAKIASLLGSKIGAPLCMRAPVLTEGGGIVCRVGEPLSEADASKVCEESCLDQAACSVEELTDDGTGGDRTKIQKCPSALFSDPSSRSCGASCPCWRLVPFSDCKPENGSSPYALEILHGSPSARGSSVRYSCVSSTAAWGSGAFAALPRCRP